MWYWGIINNASNNLGLGADGGGGNDPDIQCVFQNNGTFWGKHIHASGNVGIGTASPRGKLDIYTGSTSTAGLIIDRYSSDHYRTEFYQESDGLAIKVGDSSAPSEIMRVTPSKIGVGTPTPRARIQIGRHSPNNGGTYNTIPSSNMGQNVDMPDSTLLWMANRFTSTEEDYWGCAMGVLWDGHTYIQSVNKKSTAVYNLLLQSNGGYVGIGTSSPGYKLHISDGDNSVTLFGPNTTWSSYLVVGAGTDKTVNNNTAYAQCISTNGNLHLDAGHTRDIYMNHYSGAYIRHGGSGLFSDDRLKSEEELITNATDTLLKLSPQKYLKKRTLREDEHREPVIETGLIAQDIWYDAPELRHIVLPGADADPTENKPEAPVDGDIQQDPDYSSWGPNAASVNYDGLIAYLVKSNQELHGEIQTLKARITTLENA
jgi:hypothetical protein